MKSFSNILDLLKSTNNTSLYDLSKNVDGSVYNGDYGILKIYESIYCLLRLKCSDKNDKYIYCVPQSWMADSRIHRILENQKIIYMDKISMIPSDLEIYE